MNDRVFSPTDKEDCKSSLEIQCSSYGVRVLIFELMRIYTEESDLNLLFLKFYSIVYHLTYWQMDCSFEII